MSQSKPVVYIRVSELFRNAEPSTLAEDVRKELQNERAKSILDETLVRQQEDWSFLAHQVVGGEERMPSRSDT